LEFAWDLHSHTTSDADLRLVDLADFCFLHVRFGDTALKASGQPCDGANGFLDFGAIVFDTVS
jgi:hypothetical protein